MNKNNLTSNSVALTAGSVLMAISSSVFAADHSHHAHMGHDHSRPDSHAPIGVMGDHLMPKGEWMMSYRYMQMQMQGMRSGTDDVSPEQVAGTANSIGGETMRMGYMMDGSPRNMMVPPTYRISPLEMDMTMHMVGLMYGYSDDVTAMVMFNYIQNEMTSRTYMGMMGTNAVGEFTGETSGIGDTMVAASIRLDGSSNHDLLLNAGISLPTGSIEESGSVLPPFSGMMGTQPGELVSIDRLGYPMQLGSGTVDLVPGITYTGNKDMNSWGAQAKAVLRFYDNSEDYRLGNEFEVTGWAARKLSSWASSSVRLTGKTEGGIKGRDPMIQGGSPVANPENSGRDAVDIGIGVNLLGTSGVFKGQRLAIEYSVPVYEKVDGLQMSHDSTLTLGAQFTF